MLLLSFSAGTVSGEAQDTQLVDRTATLDIAANTPVAYPAAVGGQYLEGYELVKWFREMMRSPVATGVARGTVLFGIRRQNDYLTVIQ
ncbi:hypothetical protein GCM10022627_13560 [Haloarcula argentinensis]|uniref:Uncharacterized protein n=1 Tax=Haloarcula argentinensis TaxID=43776 RepID=A0A830FIR6_HALAR|nr:hypothetical protein GCM10009006_05830 [Haloarcula argentinensis]